MNTLGPRLRKAIKEWPAGPPPQTSLTVSGFQKTMAAVAQDRGLTLKKGLGVSYPAIIGYLKGHRRPSLDFLELASEVLGVRLAWLILGHARMGGHEVLGFSGEMVRSIRICAKLAEGEYGLGELAEWDTAREAATIIEALIQEESQNG